MAFGRLKARSSPWLAFNRVGAHRRGLTRQRPQARGTLLSLGRNATRLFTPPPHSAAVHAGNPRVTQHGTHLSCTRPLPFPN